MHEQVVAGIGLMSGLGVGVRLEAAGVVPGVEFVAADLASGRCRGAMHHDCVFCHFSRWLFSR